MRFLGLVLAGALALTPTTAVQAGSLGPGWYLMPDGWDGDWRRTPGPSRQPAAPAHQPETFRQPSAPSPQQPPGNERVRGGAGVPAPV